MDASRAALIVPDCVDAADTVDIDDARIESRNTPFYLDGTTQVNFNSGLYRDTNFREGYANYDLPVPHLVAGASKNLLINHGVKGYLANKKGDKPGQVDYFTDIVGTESEVAPGGERKCVPLQDYLAPSEHCVEVAQVFDAEGKAVWPSYSEDQPSYRYNCEIKIKPAHIGEVYFDSLPLAVYHHEKYGENVTINLCRDSFGIGIQAGAPLTIDFSDDVEHGVMEAHTYDVRTTCTDERIPAGIKTGFYAQAGGEGAFVIKNGTLNRDPFSEAEATTLIASCGNFVIKNMTLNADEHVRTATTLTYIDAVAAIIGTTSVHGEALVAVGQAADGQELFFDNTIAIEADALTFDNLAGFDCTKTLVERRKGLALDAPAGYYWAQSAKGDDIEVLAKIGELPKPKPTSFVYNGQEHWGVEENDLYTLEGTASATNAGTYTVTVTLKDPNTTKWSDGSVDPVDVEWKITKRPITLKVVVEPDPLTIEEALQKKYKVKLDDGGDLVEGDEVTLTSWLINDKQEIPSEPGT